MTAPKGPTSAVVPHPKTDASSSGPQLLQPSGWPMPKATPTAWRPMAVSSSPAA